jgi:hypothetical protein
MLDGRKGLTHHLRRDASNSITTKLESCSTPIAIHDLFVGDEEYRKTNPTMTVTNDTRMDAALEFDLPADQGIKQPEKPPPLNVDHIHYDFFDAISIQAKIQYRDIALHNADIAPPTMMEILQQDSTDQQARQGAIDCLKSSSTSAN